MKIKAVFFDLDGTLLPMDLMVFFGEYFKHLTAKLMPYGYSDPKKLVKTMWEGVDRVCLNDGKKTNENVFWDYFISVYGEKTREHLPILDDFYRNEFQNVKSVCGYNPNANATVKKVKSLGLRAVVATQPIFPEIAILKRMEWAGVDASDFEYITSYDKCNFCKPRTEFYAELAKTLGLSPEECLMVGNDVSDDMPASEIGMKVFLLTDCLINKKNEDISRYRNGSFEQLSQYIDELIKE